MLLPRFDSVDGARIWIGFEVTSKPIQVDSSRIVATFGLGLDIAGLTKPSQPSAYSCFSDGEQLCRRLVRTATLRSIRLYQTSLEIDRKVHFNL